MTTLAAWLLNKTTLSGASDATPIASDMVGDSPVKTKFLFTVEFLPRAISLNGSSNVYATSSDDIGASKIDLGAKEMDTIKYDLKTAGRPNPTINYEEVNYYGFRTKVATRTSFGTVQLVFYEDSLNRANNLLWLYLNAVSPLTRTAITDSANFNYSTEADIQTIRQTIAELPDGAADGIFASMSVYHYYPISNGRGTTKYTYLNPRIESATYDELDMAGSDASTVTIVFNVDAISVEHSREDYTTVLSLNGGGVFTGQFDNTA